MTEKETLIDSYVTRVIDGLDLDDCLAILHDYMTKSYEDYTLKEMKEEVTEYYPELLDPSDHSSYGTKNDLLIISINTLFYVIFQLKKVY